MVALAEKPVTLDLRTVALRTAPFFARHWAWLLLITLPLLVVPQVAFVWVAKNQPVAGLIPHVVLLGSFVSQVILSIITTAPASVLAVVVIRQAGRDIAGPTLGDVHPPFGVLPRVMAAMLMIDVATSFASMFLVIPGLVLSLAWAVALPIIVLEGLGPIRSLSRSAHLTLDRRMEIFFLALAALLACIPFGLAAYLIARLAEPHFSPLVRHIFNQPRTDLPAIATVVFDELILFVGTPMLYFELLRLKSGIGAQRLSGVFD